MKKIDVDRHWRSTNAMQLGNYNLELVHKNNLDSFWATICKTVRPCYQVCLSCLSVSHVCNVGVLWPNGWMDQDETWQACRPRPWPHCVRWAPSSAPQKGAEPQFSAHVYCGQMSGWMKMPLGREVNLSPSDIVLDGDPPPPPKKGAEPPFFGPYLLWPNGWMDQDAIW